MTVELTIAAEAGADEALPRPEPAAPPAAEPAPGQDRTSALLPRAAFFAALRRKADARLAAFG